MESNAIGTKLNELAAQTAAMTPTDKDAIVRVGMALENLAGPLAAAGPACAELVQLALSALQGLYQETLAQPAAVVDALARAIDAGAKCFAAGTGDCPAEDIARLKAALSAPAATPEPAPAPQPGDPACSLGDIAAELLTLDVTDRPGLTDLAGKLQRLADNPAEPPKVRDSAVSAGRLLREALADGDANKLSQAMTAIEEGMCEIDPLVAAEAAAKGAAEPAPAPARTPDVPAQAPAPQAPASAPAPVAAAAPEDAPILPADTDADLLKEYIVESLDHIAAAEASLLSLETNPGDAEELNRVFRAFHTIKGTSGFLGLSHVQKLAHLAESMLDRARSGQIHLTGGYADLALKSCDALKGMIEALKSTAIGEAMFMPANYGELMGVLKDPEAAGVSEESQGEDMRLGEILVGRNAASRDAVEQAVGEPSPRPLGEKLVTEGLAKAADVAKALRLQKQIGGQATAASADSSIRVDTKRLDSLIDMVGEIVIAHSMVAQDPDVTSGLRPRLQRNVAHTGKIVRSLQDLAMSLRMIPLKPTFQKMARLVRDVARKNNKSVQFLTEGEDTEIDRNMVEVLNDPLVHMMRNAVDHGIEPADARRAKGKSDTGTVVLRAYHAAGNVVLELQDDGKGLDRDRILAKAVERGIIDRAAELTDSEIYNLIFMPGFSTAEKVTDVSGRGVGMDVVKRNIEALRGRVDISSTPGQGSLFTLRLPLTMAITDAMLIRVAQERYLVPTVSILRSFRPEPGMISTVAGRGEMVMLRGELMPMFRLHKLFNVPGAITNPADGLLIIVQAAGKSVALMVDELLGQQQVVIKSLGQSMGQIQGVSGGAILGDGRVGLILDAAGIVALAHGAADTSAAA